MNTSAIPSDLSQLKSQRWTAAYHAHGALVGIMFAVQMFIDGTGRSPAMALSALYLAALSAPVCAAVLCALLGRLRRQNGMREITAIYRDLLGPFVGGAACLLTGVLFLVDAMAAISMLSELSIALLGPRQYPVAAVFPALVVLFAAAILAGEGLERLAYLVRYALPVLLLLCAYLLVRREPLSALFPLLGKSPALTGRSALYATGAASCALCAGFLPAGISRPPEKGKRPGLKPLLAGGAFGFVLLVCVALSSSYPLLERQPSWIHLLIPMGSHSTKGELFYLAVALLECLALLLALGGSLLFATKSIACCTGARAARIAVFVFALAAMSVIDLHGYAFVFAVLPLRFPPALAMPVLALLAGRRKRRRKGEASAP